VHLYYFDQLTLAEIGGIVGATRDVLKMRLSRARQKLRELLGDEELG
jgi:DNA-directed RNA polymerase specialized sigma24 family protein